MKNLDLAPFQNTTRLHSFARLSVISDCLACQNLVFTSGFFSIALLEFCSAVILQHDLIQKQKITIKN